MLSRMMLVTDRVDDDAVVLVLLPTSLSQPSGGRGRGDGDPNPTTTSTSTSRVRGELSSSNQLHCVQVMLSTVTVHVDDPYSVARWDAVECDVFIPTLRGRGRRTTTKVERDNKQRECRQEDHKEYRAKGQE